MKVVAILQARLGSSRLQNKVLLPLCDKPMVQHIIERVQRAKRVDEVVLAVPNEPDSRLLEAIAAKTKCIYGRFDHIPANDLVARYLGAAMAYRADIVVRIPCDNPCIEPKYIDEAIEYYQDACLTFFSNTKVLYPVGPVCVDGLGAEVLSFSRLQWLDRITRGIPAYREHPHKWFYDHVALGGGGVLIQCGNIEDPFRLDVNTQEDYEGIREIYQALYPTNPQFGIDDIVKYLDKELLT